MADSLYYLKRRKFVIITFRCVIGDLTSMYIKCHNN